MRRYCAKATGAITRQGVRQGVRKSSWPAQHTVHAVRHYKRIASNSAYVQAVVERF